MNTKTRIVSLILSFVMLVTLNAVYAFNALADDGVVNIYWVGIFYENGKLVPDYDDKDGEIIHIEYIEKGGKLQLKYCFYAETYPDDYHVEWKSENSAVCDVTPDGLVRALDESNGEAVRIYCRVYDGDETLCAEDIVSVIILPGSGCCHQTIWQLENGTIVKKCIACNEELSRLPFTDLSAIDYRQYGDFIEYTSVNNKFITGTNPPYNTVFSPARAIDRAMMVTILYRMAGEPYANGGNPYASSPFTDITDTGAYYYDAACWALKNGITTEITFKPFNNVTREQTASFLFRYAKDNNQLGCRAYKNVDLSKYSDNKNISSWAIEPMQWANYNGMITGTQQGYANPQGATQRIHATKILYGFGKACNIGNFA